MASKCDNLHVEVLDGEVVLYDRELGAVHRLDALALAVWNECIQSRSVDAIASALSKQQGSDVDAMRARVKQAVTALLCRGLLPADWQNASSDAGKNKTRQHVPVRALASDEVADANRYALSVMDETLAAISQAPMHTRRDVLKGGATKMIVTAPVISTFFATGAFASGPSASAAFGVGNCKNIGYSCAVNGDCCADATGGCVANTCST